MVNSMILSQNLQQNGTYSKWINTFILKKFDIISSDIEAFGKAFSSITKNKTNYRFKTFKFQNLIEFLITIEAIENWESILPDLKAINRDFYFKGHGRDYLIEKCFHGNIKNNLLLGVSIKAIKSESLIHCLFESDHNYKVSQTYSEKDADELMENLKISLWSKMLNDYELKLLIEKGHRLEINNNYNEFMKLIVRLEHLNLLTMENLKRIQAPEHELRKERMIEMIGEIKDKDNYKVSEKLQELLANL